MSAVFGRSQNTAPGRDPALSLANRRSNVT